MNVVFTIIIITSILLLTISNPSGMLPIMLAGAKNAFNLCVTLLCTYCVWLAMLQIMQKIGATKLLSKMFMPMAKWLFKGEDEETKELICLNFSANLLGMGGVATPLGIKAMQKMDKNYTKASKNMATFVMINSTSIQLLPTTMIALRAGAGSVTASDIILPALISTVFATILGVTLIRIIPDRKPSKKLQLLAKKV